ncbi:PBECR2 nuclease fold domain-containing protein [Streptococcus sp. sy004]|uniref:PBECR3 domain-containing polyvalent protein n=1 Tax=Streptococcus sp. sy004 TaxID=2600149 RepID=UPI0011B6742E|nr:PBECR2 nuclease fold domain-containing protein [Streptococcus sp. sy004]TWT09771.1 dihydroorotate dehydrogenase [Streptococcus sp. sy004]
MKKVGKLTKKVIEAFKLDYEEGTVILLSPKRKKHMEKHRDEFSDFDVAFENIDEIIKNPDYVGRHPNGRSLEYIKRIDGNVLVAVRLGEKLDVRTMYVIRDTKLKNYIKAGRTKKM